MRTIVPIGDRAVLKRIDRPKATGRVITGDLDDEESQECVVVVAPVPATAVERVQQMKQIRNLNLHPGDHVFIAKLGVHSGWKVDVDGEKLVVIDAENILAVVVAMREMPPQDAGGLL